MTLWTLIVVFVPLLLIAGLGLYIVTLFTLSARAILADLREQQTNDVSLAPLGGTPAHTA